MAMRRSGTYSEPEPASSQYNPNLWLSLSTFLIATPFDFSLDIQFCPNGVNGRDDKKATEYRPKLLIATAQFASLPP